MRSHRVKSGFFGMLLAWPAVILAASPPGQALRPLPEKVTADIDIYPQVVCHEVSPQFIGTNLTQYATDKAQITNPATLQRVRDMGIKTVRFPNGCFADLYNWKNPASSEVTVDQFLDFCEAIGAEPYYTLNMQGGTEGLEGQPPANAPVEERIRYRHKAPNPCGNTNYYYGTAVEAVELVRKYTIERALAGKRPLTHFELGNENWGQAKTDWPPEVYGKTCEIYARAIIDVIVDAQEKRPDLEVLPYTVMVGYPSSGNNQDPTQAVDRAINVAWTAEVNRLGELGLIDAVQEHFYTYGNNTGDTLIWTVYNLNNILAVRNGVPNPRLGGYVDPALKYSVPLEWTEWNVKCWGTRPQDNLPLNNPGFEDGTTGWTVEPRPLGNGGASAKPEAARRGKAGLEIETGAGASVVRVRQAFAVKDRLPAAAFGVALWVKTDRPRQVRVILQQANDGPSKGAMLGETMATRSGSWERLIVSGAPRADTTDCELAILVTGSNVRAWVDEVQPIRWQTFSGAMPLAADRFEQQLHHVDCLRVLLEWPTPRTHYHHLLGNYPCPTLSADGSERDNAYPFKLLNNRIGDQVVHTDTQVAAFDHAAPGSTGTDFNGATPSTKDVPALSATTTRRGNELYTILVNRTSDRPIQARIGIAGCTLKPEGEVRTLVGRDIDVKGAKVEASPLAVTNPLVHTVPPYSAQVLRLVLDQVVDSPLVLSPAAFEKDLVIGRSLGEDTLTLSTTGANPVRFVVRTDADWLKVSPAAGKLASDRPETLQLAYDTSRLPPGNYQATVTILSPDVYNSPQQAAVKLTVRPVRADFDKDGDVDQADLGRFEICMMAPPILQQSEACAPARLTGRDHVDFEDYVVFETCLSGEGRKPGPDCAE